MYWDGVKFGGMITSKSIRFGSLGLVVMFRSPVLVSCPPLPFISQIGGLLNLLPDPPHYMFVEVQYLMTYRVDWSSLATNLSVLETVTKSIRL